MEAVFWVAVAVEAEGAMVAEGVSEASDQLCEVDGGQSSERGTLRVVEEECWDEEHEGGTMRKGKKCVRGRVRDATC